jgi:hypothetical protein
MPELTERSLRGFADDAADEYTHAAAAVGELRYGLHVAGRAIGLRVAGSALADALIPAFGARITVGPPQQPDFTIRMWEEVSCPGGAIRPPWRTDDLGPRGLVSLPGDDTVTAVQNAAVTLFDSAAGEVLYRVRDVRTLEWFELRSPLRAGLFFALEGDNRHLVHGAVVGDRRRGGALIAGKSGSGKTTLSLAALAGGLSYVSDDYCLLDVASGPVAWNIFGNAKLDDGHCARFPDFGAVVSRPRTDLADEKTVLDVAQLFPDAVVQALPIRCVVCPSIKGGATRWRPVGNFQGLLALAPSTSLQMPFDGGAVVQSLAKLVGSVPSYALDVGDEPADLCDALEAILEEIARAQVPARE